MRLLLPILLLAACTVEKRPPGQAYSTDFATPLGAEWKNTGANYRVAGGELVIDNALNHPLWLTRPIPRDAVIELDAWSNDPAGDIKVEIWGDGKSFAQTVEYTATSYVFIFGGWHNQLSAIARLDEHGHDRRIEQQTRVVPGRHYHFRIARKAGHIEWQVDGKPFLVFDDAAPLDGPDHAYLGFNDWQAEIHFDNLKISQM